MLTELAILVAVVIAGLALAGAELTSLPGPTGRAWLAIAACGNVGLVLLAVLGPDDQRTWRLLAAAAVAAVSSVLVWPYAPWVHAFLAGVAGIIVVDRLRRWLEPVFTPDSSWTAPALFQKPEILAWAAALLAGTVLVCVLRRSRTGRRLAMAPFAAIVAAESSLVLPTWAVLMLLTGVPVAVALVPGHDELWLA